MNETLKKDFLSEYQSARNQANKREEINKVRAKYKDFLLTLNKDEALSLGTEMGLWIEKESIPLN